MASTPDILSKLNVGSGMNNSDIISSLVEAERAPALDRIEKNETATKNKISSYGVLKSDIQGFRDIVRTIKSSNAASHIGSSSNTTARVRTWDASTNILIVATVAGEFTRGETLVGGTSGASYELRVIDVQPADDGFADNINIEIEADKIIDFSEQNPFGMP